LCVRTAFKEGVVEECEGNVHARREVLFPEIGEVETGSRTLVEELQLGATALPGRDSASFFDRGRKN
jgi:hypothetical protein